MCYSWEASLSFAVVGWATAAALMLWRGRSSKYAMLPAWFALMETIQALQYGVTDQCASKVNQALTLAAFVHIAFSPLVFNEWMWSQASAAFGRPAVSEEADRTLQRTVRRLCAAGGLMMLAKAAPAFLQLFNVGAPELVPLVGPQMARSLTGPGTWCRDAPEMVCGRRLCSFSGRFHIAWSIPQLPSSYYIPAASLQAFLFFGPALLLGGLPQRLMGLAALATGPLVTDRVVAGDERARRFEWASMWCLFSMAQVLLLIAIEVASSRLFGGGKRARLPANSKHLAKGGAGYYGASTTSEPGAGEAIAVIHMYGNSQFPGYRQRSGFKAGAEEALFKQV